MSRKSIMLALAAIVSLGTIALSASDASAFGRGYGNGGARMGGNGVHLGVSSGLHVSNFRYRPWPTFNPHHNHWHWRFAWRRNYWIAPVIGTGFAATYATTPATNRCTCLTKDYTPQGAVVFKDVCTNEMAMNPPVNAAPAADMGPQQPMQQQGYLQPQPTQVR
jgi:hypothetical protein